MPMMSQINVSIIETKYIVWTKPYMNVLIGKITHL